MRIAITGHRPQRLNKEYDGIGPMSDWLREEINKVLDMHSPTQLISGMALGVDQLFAEIAIKRNLDLLAAIPCKNQEKMWPQKSKDRYNEILQYPNCEKVYVSESYSGWAMQKRNQYMVDNCDLLIACWNHIPQGGTYNCVRYAQSKNIKIEYINPLDCDSVGCSF